MQFMQKVRRKSRTFGVHYIDLRPTPSIKIEENQSVSLKDYKELQKKVQQLEMENEILKKATAIFARKQ